jgi:hypothetical protein
MGGHEHHRRSWKLRIWQDVSGYRDCPIVESAMGDHFVNCTSLSQPDVAVAHVPLGQLLQVTHTGAK